MSDGLTEYYVNKRHKEEVELSIRIQKLRELMRKLPKDEVLRQVRLWQAEVGI